MVGAGGPGPGGGGQEPVHTLRRDRRSVRDAVDDGEAVGDGLVGHAAAALPQHPSLQQLFLGIRLSENIIVEYGISASHQGAHRRIARSRNANENGGFVDRLSFLAGCPEIASIGAALAHESKLGPRR